VPDAAYVRLVRAAAIGSAAELVESLAQLQESPDQIALVLRRHQAIELVREAVGRHHLQGLVDARILAAIESQRPLRPLTGVDWLAAWRELSAALASRGIPALLVKGLWFAERLYGGLARRPQFDIDVLVPAARFRPASRALEGLGFTRRGYDFHSRTYLRGAVKVDLHGWLRRAPAYRLSEAAMWASAQTVSVGGTDVRTLSDEFHVLLVALSIVQDLWQGMARLRQVLDLFLLVRAMDPDCDWESFFARRHEDRTAREVASVLALVIEIFDPLGGPSGGAAEVPRLRAALEARRRELIARAPVDPAALFLAPRKSPANMAWFRTVYSGSVRWYLVRFWFGNFPRSLKRLRPARVVAAGRMLLRPAWPSSRRPLSGA
jgi:hypothetical protein